MLQISESLVSKPKPTLQARTIPPSPDYPALFWGRWVIEDGRVREASSPCHSKSAAHFPSLARIGTIGPIGCRSQSVALVH
jgi:hypothetical protein